MSKVTFDGPNKLIIVDNGITELDVQIDIYSDWKEWMVIGSNSKYLVAITAVGGDPLPGSQKLGITFFLESGWKIRPYEGDHTLTVTGNLYARDGSSPFVHTIGNYNVGINLSTSNLVAAIDTSGIAAAVLDSPLPQSPSPGSIGEKLQDILDAAELAGLM